METELARSISQNKPGAAVIVHKLSNFSCTENAVIRPIRPIRYDPVKPRRRGQPERLFGRASVHARLSGRALSR